MNKLLILISFLIVGWPVVYGNAAEREIAPDIDVVWSSSDGLKMEIFYAQRKEGTWHEPVQISDDQYDNMYPVIDRDSSGRRLVFWTAYQNNVMELHYTTGRDSDWQQAEVLETGQRTNISPSIVVDSNDLVWVVWSANDGGLDDIMYAYYKDGGWSDPALVHDENEVADLLPVIDIDENGAPVVSWRVLQEGETLTVQSRWADGEFSEPVVIKAESDDGDEKESDLLELPSYVKNSSMIFIRRY